MTLQGVDGFSGFIRLQNTSKGCQPLFSSAAGSFAACSPSFVFGDSLAITSNLLRHPKRRVYLYGQNFLQMVLGHSLSRAGINR
ncbi:MAG TPA: hypothetical protein VK327_03665 [Candidatus Paceibacterota bacterium]|nr:hypothetical protein [Candidatus Paceibacterota bacterium]